MKANLIENCHAVWFGTLEYEKKTMNKTNDCRNELAKGNTENFMTDKNK